MVYPDFNDPARSAPSNKTNDASIFQRFFSSLLDYLILSPITAFVVVFCFRESIGALKAREIAGDLGETLSQIMVFAVLIFTALQSLCIYFRHATPGQYFLKVNVHFESRQANHFFQIWLRQIGVVISLLMMGIPFLAILYHARKRPFYDRLCESDVISRVEIDDGALVHFAAEKRYVSTTVSTVLIFVSFSFFISYYLDHVRGVERHFGKMAEGAGPKRQAACFTIEKLDEKDRLKAALTLNMLNLTSTECLDREADYALQEDPASDETRWAYFAKYLTAVSLDDELAYLKRACVDPHFKPCEILNEDRGDPIASSAVILRSPFRTGEPPLTGPPARSVASFPDDGNVDAGIDIGNDQRKSTVGHSPEAAKKSDAFKNKLLELLRPEIAL